MPLITDPGRKAYFLDGPSEGDTEDISHYYSNRAMPERIIVFKRRPLHERIPSPQELCEHQDYHLVHRCGNTSFYSLTRGLDHHKVHLIERYLGWETHEEGSQRRPRTATEVCIEQSRRHLTERRDYNARMEREVAKIQQSMSAGLDDSIMENMDEVLRGGMGMWNINPETARLIREGAYGGSAFRRALDEPTKPPPIQPPDCSFCDAKKLEVFFTSKRVPGQDGKKRVACQSCMEEREAKRLAKEVKE